jgi:subtilisin family serine protease
MHNHVWRTSVTAIALALGWSLLPGAPAVAAVSGDDPAAPLIGVQRDDVIDGSYLVVMDPNASSSQEHQVRTIAAAGPGDVTADLDAASAPTVVAASNITDGALDRLRTAPGVAYVEADQLVSVSDAGWGLDRIDQRDLPLNSSYLPAARGAGVTAYIVDTGIRATHHQFGGRVGAGYSAIDDGRGTDDCHGHGTHVAGTVGGATYGVAARVTLRPVRVLGCDGSGTMSGVIGGIDWAISNHSSGDPAVMNMSLGGDASSAIDSAVDAAVADGITVVVAAGNDNADACQDSPARAPRAITVGATTSSDARASFSNRGSCVDLFAPGSSIVSAGIASDTASRTMSGTSMASPHVAGAAAVYLGTHPGSTPAQVTAALLGQATVGKLTGVGAGSPNRLLFVQRGAAPTTSERLAPAPQATSRPRFRSTPRAGHVVRVRHGLWSKPVSKFRYRWYANGHLVASTVRPRLRVSRAYEGARLKVRVLAYCDGCRTGTARTSAHRL